MERILTRSSAIAEGHSDASCQLKSCHLPRNSADTICTTSPGQIEVMKLEGYSGAMCNKHVHSTIDRRAVVKFYKSRVRDKVTNRSPYF